MKVRLLVAAAIVYAALVYYLVSRIFPHYELIAIAMQLCLLLPFVVWVLRDSGHATRDLLSTSWTIPLICIAAFGLTAAAVSYRTSQGIFISDESAYTFQARIFGSGKLVADPLPDAPAIPKGSQGVVAYNQHINWKNGWFGKYPIGWPAVMAVPEKLGLTWLVNPLLGVALLFLIHRIASEAFGVETALPTIWMAVLSPYLLMTCVGKLSHALASVLIAAATLYCLRGIRSKRHSDFVLMFVPLVLAFHVRPYTAFLFSVTLSVAVILGLRRNLSLLARFIVTGTIAACIAGASILVYNKVFTGGYLLSPYALERSIAVPVEIGASLGRIKSMVLLEWRLAAQMTWLYSFPLVFLIAAYGFWNHRGSVAARVLAATFPMLILGHLTQKEAPSSAFGERYWSEGYFGILILAGLGVATLLSRWNVQRPALIGVAAATLVAQIPVTALAIQGMDTLTTPDRVVKAAADTYRNCDCAVFIADSAPDFRARFMNLNAGDWKAASVFYLQDRDVERRAYWANAFGRKRWVVITYNSETQSTHAVSYGSSPVAE